MGRVDGGEGGGEAARFGVLSGIHPLLQWDPGKCSVSLRCCIWKWGYDAHPSVQ